MKTINLMSTNPSKTNVAITYYENGVDYNQEELTPEQLTALTDAKRYGTWIGGPVITKRDGELVFSKRPNEFSFAKENFIDKEGNYVEEEDAIVTTGYLIAGTFDRCPLKNCPITGMSMSPKGGAYLVPDEDLNDIIQRLAMINGIEPKLYEVGIPEYTLIHSFHYDCFY